jgi:hypothetical protein
MSIDNIEKTGAATHIDDVERRMSMAANINHNTSAK